MNKVYGKRAVTSNFTFFVIGEHDAKERISTYRGFMANEQASHAIPLIVTWELHDVDRDGDMYVDHHLHELLLSTYLDESLSGEIHIPSKPSDATDKLLYEVQDYYRFQESVKELIED